MKKIIVLMMIIGLTIAVSGCTENIKNAPKPETPSYSERLFASKNPYIGDNSADGKILSLLNISEQLGSYTIELQTGEEPYALKLNFQDLVKDRDVFDKEMREKALIILALIDNAGEVQWSYPTVENSAETHINASVSRENAKEILGTDIKEYGKSQAKVQELLKKLEVDEGYIK